MPAASDYAYDVFFSYRRHDLTLDWTRWVQARLKYWLTQELAVPEAQVFMDEGCIEIGDRWPERLKDGIRLSRCMVAVWSPLYFQSSWCISEWESFRQRERQLNLQSHGLIAPMRFHDGEHFPEEARNIQCLDVERYTSTVPAFARSARAMELEDLLKPFAKQVARMIRRAPQFREEWPIAEVPAPAAPKIGLARL
jgi:hypothetical protein